MNVPHFRFPLFNLKCFGEIVTPKNKPSQAWAAIARLLERWIGSN